MFARRLVLATLIAAASFSAQAAEKYDIDPTHTQVQFTYNHMGFSNITGRFDQVQGDFQFDVADPTRSSVSITIPVTSISTGVGKLDEHLLKADFFDAAQMDFHSMSLPGKHFPVEQYIPLFLSYRQKRLRVDLHQ